MRWRRLHKALLGGAGALCLAMGTFAAPEPDALRFSTVKWTGTAASAQSTSGKEVSLGLDVELQQQLDILLRWADPVAGAATLVDAESGQVLAAAEVGRASGSLLFQPIAPAASVFKLITTTALYETTNITPKTSVCTRGGLREITSEHLVAAEGPGTLCIPFGQALGVSRNAAYAQLATQELTQVDLLETATAFGFNRRLQLDVEGQVGSLEVPVGDLEFARTATGFENSRLSVFGGAQLALSIASGGTLRQMHFSLATNPPTEEPRVMSKSTARRITKAMEVTIHSGTAHDSFVDARGRSRLGPIQAAGKTGTLRPEPGAPTTSWFIGFAPSDHPQVVVSVALQNPEKWHRLGHQLARDLLALYFKKKGVKGLSTPL